MKKVSFLLIILFCMLVIACKEKKSERFILLTTPTWATDSLLANDADASGPGQLLEKFKGDAKFNEDGTGVFGKYKGTWSFSPDETRITIASDSLVLPIVCNLVELTTLSLKITTAVPDKNNPAISIDIRMTFKAK
jgi:hypothetical protein